jgi:hypothetical protein
MEGIIYSYMVTQILLKLIVLVNGSEPSVLLIGDGIKHIPTRLRLRWSRAVEFASTYSTSLR